MLVLSAGAAEDCGDARDMVRNLTDQREHWTVMINRASKRYLDGQDASTGIHQASLVLSSSAHTIRCFCPEVATHLDQAAGSMRLLALNIRRGDGESVEVEQRMVSIALSKADMALMDCPAYTMAASV